MAGGVRVFISYSRKDTPYVEQLKRDLRDAGATIWIDHESLPIGHPDWQAAIHRGIENATTVIYVGSPDAAESTNVGAEVQIAVEERRDIIPFWVRGEQWTKCAPFELIRSNYLDARGDKYPAARDKLLATLGLRPSTASAVTPQLTPAIPSVSPYPVPARLISLGYQGVNLHGTPCYLPPLVTIPAGLFLMGSDKAQDPSAEDNEAPQYWVEVDTFQIAKYPVTVAEYALAVRAGAVPEPSKPDWDNVTWAVQQTRHDHPVVRVSWRDATAYAAWLNTVSGQRGWRLLTEAEWEKAARWDASRQRSRIYPWGDEFDTNRCNSRASGIGTTSPIGSYPASDTVHSGASPFGVEEMAGNAWEWTRSLFRQYPYIHTDGRDDQQSPASRVMRGGTWFFRHTQLRAACRYIDDPSGIIKSVGFRVGLAAPGSS